MNQSNSGVRPSHLAALLLASGDSLPRERARDQRADQVGSHIKQAMLERLISIDPDEESLLATLDGLIHDLGEPTGPTRAMARILIDEWNEFRQTPTLAAWLLNESVRLGATRKSDIQPGNRADP